MSCFPCFGKKEKDSFGSDEGFNHAPNPNVHKKPEPPKPRISESTVPVNTGSIQAQNFTFRELATATNHFTPDNLLGEGGLGRVYKGYIESIDKTVAVKQLDRSSNQGNKEFLVEVMMLSLLHHPNLANLAGYCADGDQRLLVFEFMPNGSLQDHLFDMKPNQKPIDWFTRMKIAYGAAQGIEYLHDKANPPVVYRDMKSSNILLDSFLTPKLSDYGLAKLSPVGDNPMVGSRVIGTYGYSAPECTRNGEITMKSDVYSFGVVLLELITGRRALDASKPMNEQNLVSWAQPLFKEQRRYPELVDPILDGDFTLTSLNQVVAIASMCLQDEPSVRPLMADVVMTLSFLIEPSPSYQINKAPTPVQIPPSQSQPPCQSPSSSSSADNEHVVETLQLGLTSRKSQAGSKIGSSCASSRSSSSSRRSSGQNSKKDIDGSSSSKHGRDLSDEDSDGSSSSSSKHSRGSSKHISQRSDIIEEFDQGSDGSLSRESEESDHDEYVSD
ncbi:uncharacterized protein A4U43_C08F34300 [Asparagus officinalis]|uniref:probable serine/threonine-protein kinase PBL25 n=1 Tax=Asparagus officinalis TaxID=4686 RepID=UPI00098E4370|nr:probable serine/threonine-protein kinase PBL25 [Asparagus officinalis]ONK61857.1 uncharacterized protein A4U43_C08F34300 [Asparagus officinalis]